VQFGLLTTLSVDIAAYSTISRPVFVSSTDPTAPVTLNITEVDASGNVVTGGLTSSILLNGDPSNPQMPATDETHDPAIVNQTNPNIVNWTYVSPNIVNPNIVNPNIVNPNIVNPNIVNPNIVNPNIVNPNIVNPNIGNPNIVNSSIANPNIVNPNIVNPNIVNANPADVSITDVEWTVENNGSATTSYSLKTLSKMAAPEGVYVQLLVYRVHYTPAVAGAELSAADTGVSACDLKQEPHEELVLNVVNPNIVNPNIVNPNIVNPNIVNSSIENATFSVAPGEHVIVDLRVLDTGMTQTVQSQMRAEAAIKATAQGVSAASSLQASTTQEFINSLSFAVTSQAVNSSDARQGIQIPPAAATALVIGTGSLPDGVLGAGYSAALLAYGGTGTYSWSLNSGQLPPGLTLGSNGIIAGTPAAIGIFPFIVRVDSGSQFDTQQYSITINSSSGPQPLTITTTSLPNGVQNYWYGVTLQASGGVWPRAWSLASGTLPPGLLLDSGGVISGTPTATGTSSFTVRVTDGKGSSVTQGLSLAITSPATVYYKIAGTVYDENGYPLQGAVVRGLPDTPVSGVDGTYSDLVPAGWSGTTQAFMAGHTFVPATYTYTNVSADQLGQNFNHSQTANQQWVARYNGTGNGDDAPMGMAVDSPGNVYVTGGAVESGPIYDWATLKYDGSGSKLWEEHYVGPGTGDNSAAAVAVDAWGNVYVTGWAAGSGTGLDYATIKYGPNGNTLWTATYNGPGNGDDRAEAIAVDCSGNVYVTGWSLGNGTNADYATIKYDANGNQLWVARYNGPANGNDYGNAIALDSSGNVYVTGGCGGSGTSQYYATIKYDANGNQLWLATYTGPGVTYFGAKALAVDPSGNVYVTGTSGGIGTNNFDIATVKYDTKGNQLWVATYNGPGNSEDDGQGIAVDASGNVYVTGDSIGSGTAYDYVTIKYDANGNQLWAARYDDPSNGNDYARSVVVDPLGNVYVTGDSQGNGTGQDYATIKYDANGNQLWVARYNGPGNSTDVALLAALDQLGNLYVTGESTGSGTGWDYATIKYAQSFPSTLIITTNTLDNGYVGTPYAKALWAFGGSGARSWSIVNGSGSLPPGLSLNSMTGVISGTPTTVGPYSFTVQVVDGSLTAIQALTMNINAAILVPHQLAFTQQPTSASSGVTISPPVTVQIQDQSGNPVTTATNTVTMSLGNAPGATLSGTTSKAAVGGVATFNDLSVDKAGSGYILKANSGGLTEADSSSFAIGAGAGSTLTVETAPDGTGTVVPAQNVRSGSSITAYAISRDIGGNFIANVAADSWSLISITGGVVGTDLVKSGDMKSATFTGNALGSAVIHAIKSGYTSVDSGALTVIAANEWTWISGSKTVDQQGTYGTQGTANLSNMPGARDLAVSWADSSGKLWLFGGFGCDSSKNYQWLNDLWEYDPTTNEWTWVSGSNTGDQAGIFGNSTSLPGARMAAVSWIDSSGNLWLFGGLGYDSAGKLDYLNDLWEYDPTANEWTWVSGSSTADQKGTYGTKGTADPSNVPGARENAISWVDSSGKLWLFGGNGYDSAGNVGWINDLWKYDPPTNEWTWVSSSTANSQAGTYGTQGTAASANVPGARDSAVSWTDSSGKFWLFGGEGLDSLGHNVVLNDLWKYDPATNMWTWVSGSNTGNQAGTYGTQGTAASANVPGAGESGLTWVDSTGILWLFGGKRMDSKGSWGLINDLWKYDPTTNNWTWVSGSNTVGQWGSYGTLGTANRSNIPGARGWSIGWIDSNGALWLFGGGGYDSAGTNDYLNDLWKYIR
jgi:N-acetylneuraminic acid mutarotase